MEASNEIIELDARSEKQILDQSANEILELDCESNKTSAGFLIKNERNSALQINKVAMVLTKQISNEYWDII